MEKKKDTLKDYVKSLNDEDFKSLYIMLTERVGSDISDSVTMIEKHSEMKRYFVSTSAEEFYDKLDKVENALKLESKKRNLGTEFVKEKEKVSKSA